MLGKLGVLPGKEPGVWHSNQGAAPPLLNKVLYWPNDNDGEYAVDKLENENVDPGLVATDVNCLQCGAGYVDTGVKLNYGSSDYAITIEFMLPASLEVTFLFDSRDANNDGIRFSFSSGNLWASHNTKDLVVNDSFRGKKKL